MCGFVQEIIIGAVSAYYAGAVLMQQLRGGYVGV